MELQEQLETGAQFNEQSTVDDQLTVDDQSTVDKQSTVTGQTTKITFWIMYAIIVLAFIMPPIVIGGIEAQNISCYEKLPKDVPYNFVYPPAWLIVYGCVFGLGTFAAGYPTYYFIFHGFSGVAKNFYIFLSGTCAIIILCIVHLIFSIRGFGISKLLLDTNLSCVETVSQVIYGYSIAGATVVGIIVFGCMGALIYWKC